MRYVVGLLLAAVGALVPSATLVGWLRDESAQLEEQLLQGALCFRIGLVVLGMTVVFLGWFASRLADAPNGSPPSSTPAGAGRWSWALGALLVVAAAMRLHALGAGFWFDEIAAYVNYGHLTLGEIVTTYDSQNQHILYTILASLALEAGGDSVAAFRLPAVVFGVASIWALYLFATRVVNRREALLAAALMTFSYHHVWFSQNARGYIGLLFWTLLASWALVRALEGGAPRRWTVYAVIAALGAWTLPTMVFVIAGHFAIYVGYALRDEERPTSRRLVGLLFGFGLAGLLTLQLYALVLPQMFGGTLSKGGLVESWKNPLWALLEAARGLGAALPGGLTGIALVAGGVIVLGVLLLGAARLWRSARVVVWLLFVPVLLTAAVAVVKGHHIWPRLFFFALGFGAMLAVAAAFAAGDIVSRLTGGGVRKAVFVGTLFAVLGIAVSAVSVPRAYGPKQDFEGAMRFVEDERRQGDVVLTVGLAKFPYRDYFTTTWHPIESKDDLDQALSASGRSWLVYTFPFHLREVHPGIWATVERDFGDAVWFHGTLGGGAVVVTRR